METAYTLWIRQTWNTLTITPAQARECASALRQLQKDVHARVDALPTPDEVFARIQNDIKNVR